MIPSRLKHLTLAIFLLAFLACAGEVALRLYSDHTGMVATDAIDPAGHLVRSRQVHHELPPSKTLTFSHPDREEAISVMTNRFGLRGNDIAIPKPTGVYRVICLGDDNVFGTTVPRQQTACEQLQQYLQSQSRLQIEVINAGVPGYCPLLSLLQFEHRLVSLQPDLVVMNFDMTDVSDDRRYRRHTVFVDEATPTICSHPDFRPLSPGEKAKRQHPLMLVEFGKKYLLKWKPQSAPAETNFDIDIASNAYCWLQDSPPDWNIHIQQSLEPISQLQQSANSVFARFMLVVSPAPWQVSANATADPAARAKAGVPSGAHYRSRRPFEIVQQFAAAHGITHFDLSPTFQQQPQPESLFLYKSPEWSAAGHDLFANQVAAFVTRNFPGPWEYGPYTPRDPGPVADRITDRRGEYSTAQSPTIPPDHQPAPFPSAPDQNRTHPGNQPVPRHYTIPPDDFRRFAEEPRQP